MGFVRDWIQNLRHFHGKWLQPILPTKQWGTAMRFYARYLSDWSEYSKMPGHETWHFTDTYPCLFDRTVSTSFDVHYFYQSIWAFQAIKESGVTHHVDIGSQVAFVGMLTTITRVTFVDIRPLVVDLENFESRPGDILDLPFETDSIPSLSCLHVAEHIGLGRYGDRLDPEGTKKAARELARVLAPQGNLYFSLPVGRPRLCFNAHRIHTPQQVIEYFDGLDSVNFSAVSDSNKFLLNIDPAQMQSAAYACGLFWFRKPTQETDSL